MSLKIAVFFDESNNIASVFNPSIVKIFEKNEYTWAANRGVIYEYILTNKVRYNR
jgi:hypothetical protein